MRHKELSRSLMCFPAQMALLMEIRKYCQIIYKKSPNSHTKMFEVYACRKKTKTNQQTPQEPQDLKR